MKKRIISIFLSSMLIASTLFVHPVFAEPEFKHEQAFWNKNANVPIFVKEKLAKKTWIKQSCQRFKLFR